MKRLILAAGLVVVATPALGKVKFQPLETREPLIEMGEGGTKVSKHGIDYWTSGQPPRRFQVLGVIVDTRGTGALHGDAIGSKSVAKKVKEVGGDAVIILAQGTKMTGTIGGGSASAYGNSAYGSGWTTAVGKTRISLAVIRYLPDTP